MTFLEAINSIEKKVEKLHIKWKDDGSPKYPIEALGQIGNWAPERYNKIINDLDQGMSTMDQYYMEMIRLIADYTNRMNVYEKNEKGQMFGI